MPTREYVLLFDGECGLCSALGRWVHAVDLRRRIRIRTIQSSHDLLREVPEEQVSEGFHVIEPGGRVTTAGDAVPTLLEAFPMGAGFARVLRESDGLMARVRRLYLFLVRFRERLVCRVDVGATSAGSGP